MIGPATLVIKNCGKCPYVDHSGAFTPGGAVDICGHPNAVETFTASVDRDDPNQDKWHWKHRAVDRLAEPPAECPLRAMPKEAELDPAYRMTMPELIAENEAVLDELEDV